VKNPLPRQPDSNPVHALGFPSFKDAINLYLPPVLLINGIITDISTSKQLKNG
jgi:hypothetical protein